MANNEDTSISSQHINLHDGRRLGQNQNRKSLPNRDRTGVFRQKQEELRVPQGRKGAPPAANPPMGRSTPNENPVMKNEPLWQDKHFPKDVSVQPVRPEPIKKSGLQVFIDIVEDTYQKIAVRNKNFHQWVPLSAFTYYSVTLLWKRIVEVLDIENRPQVTPEWRDFLTAINRGAYAIPRTFSSYFRALGKFETMAGDQLAWDSELPVFVESDGCPGWYGRVDLNTHNLYEEVPCPGVAIWSMMRDSDRNVPIGDYDLPNDIQPEEEGHGFPTRNLLGWRPKMALDDNTVHFLSQHGITGTDVPASGYRCYPLFVDLIRDISDRIKNDVPCDFVSQGSILGSQVLAARTYVQHPQPQQIGGLARQKYTWMRQITRCRFKIPDHLMSGACMFNLWIDKQDFRIEQNVVISPWCCYRFNNYRDVPQLWRQNRNERTSNDSLAHIMRMEFESGWYEPRTRRSNWVTAVLGSSG